MGGVDERGESVPVAAGNCGRLWGGFRLCEAVYVGSGLALVRLGDGVGILNQPNIAKLNYGHGYDFGRISFPYAASAVHLSVFQGAITCFVCVLGESSR